jgi:hypothetical protein
LEFLDEFNETCNSSTKEMSKKEAIVVVPPVPQSSYKVKSFPLSCLPKLTGHRTIVTGQTILTFGGAGENSRRMKHLIASTVDFTSDLLSSVDVGVGGRLLASSTGNVDDDDLWKNSSNYNRNELLVNTRIVSENAKFYERLHSSAVYVPNKVKEGETADSVLIFGGRKSPMDPCVNDLIELNLENTLSKGDIGSVILSSTYGKCPPARWRHAMTLCSKGGSYFVFLFGGRNTEVILQSIYLLKLIILIWF